MIKTLIKHIIAETAINTFFSNVSNNFTNPIGKFKKNESYVFIRTAHTINTIRWIHVFWGCEIIDNGINGKLLIKYDKGQVFKYLNGDIVGERILLGGYDTILVKNIAGSRIIS